MKQKNTIVFLLLLIVRIPISCDKKNDPAPPVTGCKLTSFTNGGYNTNVTYRTDGKIDKITFDDEVRTFSYTGNTITVQITDAGVFNERITTTLNADGLPTNVRGEYNVAGTEWYNDAFEYNGKELYKRVVSDSYSAYTQTTTYTWANGNMVKEQSAAYGTTVYDYFTDKDYKEGDYFYLEQFMTLSYQYVFNKNMLKSSKTGNYPVDFYYYTYDADGKILSYREDNNSTTTFTYKCN